MKDVLHKKFKLSSSGSGSKGWRLNIPSNMLLYEIKRWRYYHYYI